MSSKILKVDIRIWISIIITTILFFPGILMERNNLPGIMTDSYYPVFTLWGFEFPLSWILIFSSIVLYCVLFPWEDGNIYPFLERIKKRYYRNRTFRSNNRIPDYACSLSDKKRLK